MEELLWRVKMINDRLIVKRPVNKLECHYPFIVITLLIT